MTIDCYILYGVGFIVQVIDWLYHRLNELGFGSTVFIEYPEKKKNNQPISNGQKKSMKERKIQLKKANSWVLFF